jgi:hypothetical protein
VKRDGIPNHDEPGQGCHPWHIGLIDDLKITPDPNTHHLVTIEDTAPAPSRDYGFKPGPADLYKYDQNGNPDSVGSIRQQWATPSATQRG